MLYLKLACDEIKSLCVLVIFSLISFEIKINFCELLIVSMRKLINMYLSLIVTQAIYLCNKHEIRGNRISLVLPYPSKEVFF